MWWRCEGFVWSLSYPRPNYSSLLAANGSECGEAKTALKSVHPPVTFPPPPHFKLGFLYSYFNGFILFFFSLTYIWLWAWWKAAVGGFSSLLSFRWKECGISSDLIPCQIKIHFSQQLSANVNKWTTVRFGVAAAETTTATTKYKREQEQRDCSCFKLTLIF